MQYCPYCGSRSEVNNFMPKGAWRRLPVCGAPMECGGTCVGIKGHENCKNASGHACAHLDHNKEN